MGVWVTRMLEQQPIVWQQWAFHILTFPHASSWWTCGETHVYKQYQVQLSHPVHGSVVMILEHPQQGNHCTSIVCNYKIQQPVHCATQNTCTNLWLLHVFHRGWGYILIYYCLLSKEQMPMYSISEAAPSRFLSGQTKQSVHWHDHTSRFLHTMYVCMHILWIDKQLAKLQADLPMIFSL